MRGGRGGWPGAVARRAGRRGAFLGFLAVLDLAYGYSLLTATGAQRRQLDLLLPWPAWGWAWVAVGVICAAGALATADRLAFTAAAALKAAWAATWAVVWLIEGIPRGWVSVVVWGCFALVVLVVSSWPEAPRP